ncbi:MAG: dephospho-CoA kinase [Chloroflexi bacterium]|nr:dephospho-CoA kinase [Chloroflexota bacterium]
MLARLTGAMIVIGLTGGIGTGKTTVAEMLAEMGARVIDADKLGHEALRPDTPVWQELVAAFGNDILKGDRQIDRAKLGEIVFNNPAALKRINAITHPRLYRMVESQIEEYRRQGVKVVVVEAAALIEANWRSLTDEVWATVASQECVLERVKKRSNFGAEQIMARIRSQISSEERVKHATVVIDTDCTLEGVRERVAKEWKRLTQLDF